MKIKVGDQFPLNQGGACTVTEYNGWDDVVVVFNDDKKCSKSVQATHLRKGHVRNPYYPTVFGVGFIGDGSFPTRRGGKDSQEYGVWMAMMTRCYCPRYQKKHPTYIGCTVHPDWHDFQVFAEWYTNHDYYGLGYELDKDLLIKENRVYSEKNCCLLPPSINTLIRVKAQKSSSLPIGVCKTKFNRFEASIFMNSKHHHLGSYESEKIASDAYVFAKESHVKAKAKEWKGRLCGRSFNALMKWKVYK